jgi:hypothetical protein
MAKDGGSKVPGGSHTEPLDRAVAFPDAAAVTPGFVLAGRYVVDRVLGRGGMGVVVRADDRVLGEAVAIKILRPEYAAERRWVERLAREVKLARQINHPNVCRVFDFEQAEGHAFVVMELAARGTLRAEMDSGALAARPLSERLADVRAIVAGLAAVHAAGVIHRDVTPQNVLRMADGRLVVSDFGLAIDVFQSTTSFRGGTVAYMPPEVSRGEPATLASDVWSLGVLLHEVVFGEKPRWRSPGSERIVAPRGEGTLSSEERVVLEACRACARARPRLRPRLAGEVAFRLAASRPSAVRSRWRAIAAIMVVGGAALVTYAVALRPRRAHLGPTASQVPPTSGTVVPRGEPVDWTDVSKVLGTYEGRVHCVSVLPDRRTVRVVWGVPPRAEDVETSTGARRASPLVPEAYREGCPDASPDGHRLVYQGYTTAGRAYAFVSERSDGANGVPVVPIADPSLLSDPKWLPDGKSFVFDADLKHVGVFSTETNRIAILPDVTGEPIVSVFRFVAENHVFVSAAVAGNQTELVGFTWPSWVQLSRVRLPGLILDVVSRDGTTLYATRGMMQLNEIIEIDSGTQSVRRLGSLRNRIIHRFAFVDRGAVFVGSKIATDLWRKGPGGTRVHVTHDVDLESASRCGSGFVIARVPFSTIVRIDSEGKYLDEWTLGPQDRSPACSPDGKVLYFVRDGGEKPGIYRCDAGGCRRLTADFALSLDASPDGTRLAYLGVGPGGPRIALLSVEGGEPRYLVDSETGCFPGWSSAKTLWVSRRKLGKPVWIEIDVESGVSTDRMQAGAKGCLDGSNDYSSPVHPDFGIVEQHSSELRFVSPDLL